MTSERLQKRSWRETVATYSHPRVVTLLFLGFSAGLPFLLVFSTLSAWLRAFGVTRTAIGFISWIGITYSFKFVWSPVVDRVPLPLITRWLGRRRSWMLLAIAEPEERIGAGTAEREGKVADFAQRLGPMPSWLSEALIFLYGAIVCPFVDFFVRYRWHGITLLAFIGLFRLSDIAMGVMANPFYIDMGFSLQQIANVTKIYGFIMSILGALLGGALVFRLGAARLLAPSVFLIAASNLTFSWLAIIGRPDPLVLAVAISIDNLVSGMAGAVVIPLLSGLTPTAHTPPPTTRV